MQNYDFKLIYSPYSKKKKITNIVLTIVFLVLLSLVGIAYLLGVRTFIVYGWSAEPYVHYGSLAVDYKVKFEDLKVGDFITFSRSGNNYITHQIVEIDAENKTITTSQQPAFGEGSEDTTHDAPITYDQVKGKVIFSIPELGLAILNLTTIYGLISIVLCFVAYNLFKKFIVGNVFVLEGGRYGKK